MALQLHDQNDIYALSHPVFSTENNAFLSQTWFWCGLFIIWMKVTYFCVGALVLADC